MSQCKFTVSLMPSDVMDRIKNEEDAELVYDEFHDIGNGKYCGTIIFEKYYMRVGNRVTLMVLVNNFNKQTEVTAVAAGSASGAIFDFDWGAADDFAESVRDIFEEEIIEEIEE